MDDRQYILNNLKDSVSQKDYTIPETELPVTLKDRITLFSENVRLAGGHASLTEKSSLIPTIRSLTENSDSIYIGLPELIDQFTQRIHKSDLINYDELDISVIQGKAGIAENGAVWVDDAGLDDRRLPFISTHLIVLVKKEDIVSDLSEFYEKINPADTGFGILIAGPSKTADIEQSLVIGAQGSVKHTILIV